MLGQCIKEVISPFIEENEQIQGKSKLMEEEIKDH